MNACVDACVASIETTHASTHAFIDFHSKHALNKIYEEITFHIYDFIKIPGYPTEKTLCFFIEKNSRLTNMKMVPPMLFHQKISKN